MWQSLSSPGRLCRVPYSQILSRDIKMLCVATKSRLNLYEDFFFGYTHVHTRTHLHSMHALTRTHTHAAAHKHKDTYCQYE